MESASGSGSRSGTGTGRPLDIVWEHFKRIGKSKSGTHYVTECVYCKKIYQRGKTVTLRKHLALDCSKVPKESKSKFLKLLTSSTSDNDDIQEQDIDQPPRKSAKTSSILNHFESTQLSPDRKKNLESTILQFFVQCNIPFSVVENKFFIKLITELRPGFKVMGKKKLSEDLLFRELAKMNEKMDIAIQQEQFLTLSLDGWTDVSGKSIYAFLVLTETRKVWVHSIQDFSRETHTSEFLAKKIEEVMEDIGPEKIVALVTDNAANVKNARTKICEKYTHVLNIRCIPHFLNLVTKDILSHPKAKSVLTDAHLIVQEFKKSHQKLAIFQETQKAQGLTQSLKLYVPTRWQSVTNCFSALLANESVLRNIAMGKQVKLSVNVQKAILSRSFWKEVETVYELLLPIWKTIVKLESNSATLADTYVYFVSLCKAIEKIEDSELGRHCKVTYGLRWNEINEDVYRLACFLHPKYREKGLAFGQFQAILSCALTLWKSQGHGRNSASKLANQLARYKSNQPPYNLPSTEISPSVWWSVVEDASGNELQQLARRLLAIAPHSASCERLFSILDWVKSKRRNKLSVHKIDAIAKLNIYSKSWLSSPSEKERNVPDNDLSSSTSESEDEDVMQLPNFQLTENSDINKSFAFEAFESVKEIQNLKDPMFDLSCKDTLNIDMQIAANVEVVSTEENDANFDVSDLVSDYVMNITHDYI